MKFAELKKSLQDGTKPVYGIFGTDFYLVNKAVELITNAVTTDSLNISRLDDSATTQDIITECLTVSFLGGKRVVIIKPFTQDINSYLKNPSNECVLILVSDAPIKNVEAVDCNPMSQDILLKLIANELSKHGKKITPDAANLLCNYCANLYSRIDGELNKLVNFFAEKEILGTDEINAIVTKTQEYQVYELSNAICGGNLQRAEEILRTLQDQGVEDYAIFGNLVSSFRRTFYSLSTRSQNEAVAQVLGCSPYAVNYARRDYKALTTKIARLYNSALDLEYQIKSGKISVHNAIVLCYALT
jgi:DNA polymerase III delta subunit